MDLSKVPCQEASHLSRETYVPCGRPGWGVVFHQHDGRNVYVMCDACAHHNVKNRGGALLWPREPGRDGFRDVLEFHQKLGLPVGRRPALLTNSLFGQRSTFMLEELVEFQDAHWSSDLAKAADSLLDLVYVAKGTAVCMGLPWEKCWGHVHAANMRKGRGADEGGFKQSVTKPRGWVSPDGAIARELEAAGWAARGRP